MVLGDLLDNLTNVFNDVDNNDEKKYTDEELNQGAQYLNYRNERINKIAEKSPLLEGFVPKNSPVGKKDSGELAELKQLEGKFNGLLSKYSTMHKSLMDDAKGYLATTAPSDNNLNTNLQLGNNEVGYVTNKGYYKKYASNEDYEATAGKNGCPSNFTSVDETNPAAMSPPLMVGTPMKRGQSCGNEGTNVYVDRASDPGQPTYVGCYVDNTSNRAMEEQSTDSTYGGNYTYDMCKQQAADMGKPFFSVRSTFKESPMLATMAKYPYCPEKIDYRCNYRGLKCWGDDAEATAGRNEAQTWASESFCPSPDTFSWPSKTQSNKEKNNRQYKNIGICAVGDKKEDVTKYGKSYKPVILWSSGTGGKGPSIVHQKVGTTDYKLELRLSSASASSGALKIIAKTSSKGDVVIWSGGPIDIMQSCKYPTYGGKINDIVATYGANCATIVNPTSGKVGDWRNSSGNKFAVKNGNYSKFITDNCDNKELCNFQVDFQKYGDPAVACGKTMSVSYNCGNVNKTYSSSDVISTGGTISLDCTKETEDCKLYRVQVNDDGSFSINSGTSSTSRQLWNNGTTSTSDVSVSKDTGLFNRKGALGGGSNNFTANGKMIPGEYIVSNNGQFILHFTSDADIQLVKLQSTCHTVNNINYGNNDTDNISQAIYQMDIVNSKNIGKIGYVDGQSRLHNYPSSMISKGTGYVTVGNFNSVGNDLKTVKNVANVDSCKKACTDLDNCHGFTYNTEKTQCTLKDENMYPAGTRVMDSNYELYIRNPSVNNHNTCSEKVVPIDSGLWDKYPKGTDMTLGTLCDLGVISRPELAKLKILNKEIVGTAKQIYKKIKKLTRENSTLGKRMGIEKEYMDKQIRKFKDIYHRLQKEKLSDDQTVAGMLSDADINSTMNSNRYIMWSILAIVVAIFTIHLIRK